MKRTTKSHAAPARSSKNLRAALHQARNEALRESFRLGGAIADLNHAAQEVNKTMVELDRAVWKTGPEV